MNIKLYRTLLQLGTLSAILLPVAAHAADKSWDNAAAANWSDGPWSPVGAPLSTDNVVAPTQFGELRVNGDYTVNNFSIIGYTDKWSIRPNFTAVDRTLTVSGDMSFQSSGGATTLSFYSNSGGPSTLTVIVQGNFSLTSSGIVQFGDRFAPGDFHDLVVNGTTTLTTTTAASIAMRLNANSAQFNGGVEFVNSGGPIQFTIANDETRAGNTSVAYLQGGNAQTFVQANELGSLEPIAPDATLNINGNTGTIHTYDGILRDLKNAGNTAKLSINKTGSNTQVLTGNNAYTGTTDINGGSLVVNGNQSGATGTVTVASSATLAGTGTLGGALVINGILSPGTSIGTLSALQGATWNGGTGASAATDWVFELGAANAADRLSITGDFNKGTGTDFRFDFGGSTETGTFVLVDWTGTTSFAPGDFSYTNLGGTSTAFFQITGSQLEVVVTDTGGCTPPNELTMAGAGTYCTSSGSQVFGVTGTTEVDVDYELRYEGAVIETLTGTGSSIDFTAQSAAGSYIVIGVRGECQTAMTGDAVIYEAATANAGPDQTISPNQSAQLAGSIGGSATGGIWSGGGGSFAPDATALDAVYTPTLAETTAGSVTLTLTTTGQSSPCGAAADTVTITFANVAPVAFDQDIVIATETPTTVTLTADDVDEDPLTYSVIDSPLHGSLTGTEPDLVYTPDPGYQGPDSFTFKANDGSEDSNTATITLTVTDAPAVPGPEGKRYSFYFIGNSLTLGLTTGAPEIQGRFHGLFKDRGHIMDFGSLGGAGVNLDEHWMGLRTFDGSFMKQGIKDDQSEINLENGWAGPSPDFGVSFFRDYNFAFQGKQRDYDGTILTGNTFTGIVLQPYQAFIEADEYTASVQSTWSGTLGSATALGDRQAINNFIWYATGNNPSSHVATQRIYIYSPWPSLPGIEAKAVDTNSDGVYSFEEFYDSPYDPPKNPAIATQTKEYVPSRAYMTTLMNALTADNPGVDMRLIPVGEVMAQLDTLIRNGQLPGVADYFDRNSLYYLNARIDADPDLATAGFVYIYPAGQPGNFTSDFVQDQGVKNFYCDGIHMNDQTHNDADSGTLGAYIAAATVYACLTGENPNLHTVEQVAARYEKIDPVQDQALVEKIQEVVWSVVTADPRTKVADLPDSAISFPAYLVNSFTFLEREDPAIAGAEADFDRDGLTTIEEFFYQTDPTVPDSPAAVAILVDTGAGTATASFTGLSNARGLLPSLESSSDLAAWTRAGWQELDLAPSASAGYTDYSATFNLGSGPQFHRMALSYIPNAPRLTLVDWTGSENIVTSGSNLVAGKGSISIDLNTPSNPAVGSGYGNVDSPVFYAASKAIATDNSESAYRVVDDSAIGSPIDRLVISYAKNTGTTMHATATVLWQQDGDGSAYGFLNGADTGDVRLAGTRLRARISSRTTNVNQLRVVIRLGSQFYISDSIGSVADSVNIETFEMPNPYAVDWYTYDPETSILDIGTPVVIDEFNNLTAVGFNYRTYGEDAFRQFWLDQFRAEFFDE